MVIRFAIVRDGLVRNITMADSEFGISNGWIPTNGAQKGDSWDGKIFTRKQQPVSEVIVPTEITAVQGIRALRKAGKAKEFKKWAGSKDRTVDEQAFIQRNEKWRRNHPVVIDGAEALGLTREQVDQLFIEGSKLSDTDYTPGEGEKAQYPVPAHTHEADDITGLPAQVNADWAANSGVAQILNKPATYSPSAHSHAWGDITGKPTIPTISQRPHVNDAATNAATNAPTTLNAVAALLAELNSANARYNDLATKCNDMATKFNAVLRALEANGILLP